MRYGVGGIILIEGGVGIGKTRFLHEMVMFRLRRRKTDRARSILSAADPVSQFVPFSGFLEITRHVLRKLRLVEEYRDRATGRSILRLKTRRTRVRHNRGILDRIHLLHSVYPQLQLEVAAPLTTKAAAAAPTMGAACLLYTSPSPRD